MSATTRYEIVQKADGRIYVRTSTPSASGQWWIGAMLHKGYFPSVAAAHAEIARQKAEAEAAHKASQETVLYTEEA